MDTVRRWMSSPAVVVAEMAPLPEARRLMRERKIRRLPVVDVNGRLVGIVTEGDIDRVSPSPHTDVRQYNLYYSASTLPVREIMTRVVVAVAPDTPILELARRLLAHRIGGVPVVMGDEVVGVITESDIFRRIVSQEVADEPAAEQIVVGAD